MGGPLSDRSAPGGGGEKVRGGIKLSPVESSPVEPRVKSGRSGQVMSGRVWSGQVRSGQVRSGQRGESMRSRRGKAGAERSLSHSRRCTRSTCSVGSADMLKRQGRSPHAIVPHAAPTALLPLGEKAPNHVDIGCRPTISLRSPERMAPVAPSPLPKWSWTMNERGDVAAWPSRYARTCAYVRTCTRTHMHPRASTHARACLAEEVC